MTDADHTRHCSCPHLPADRERGLVYLHALFPRATQGEIEHAFDLASGHDTTRYHERALNNVTVPDPNGHQFWTGRIERGRPHVTYKGTRMTVAKWLWLRAGRPDADLAPRPMCHVPDCIAPDHQRLDRSPARVDHDLVSPDMAAWDAAHPRINPRPQRWNPGARGEECPRGGAAHTGFKVYGDPRLRRSYCPQCAADERERKTQRLRALASEARAVRTLRSPERVDLAAQLDALLGDPDVD